MNQGFWCGKRVLLTGHTGFKGSWLSLWLQALGAEVAGFALAPPTNRNLFQEARVAQEMRSIEGDVRDEAGVRAALHACRPEIVIHMAAQSLVRESYVQPVATYAVNVMGTVHVLEAARHCDSVRAIVNVTSDKCYLNRGQVPPYREDDPLGGHDPYSSSKACAELVASAYRLSFPVPRADDTAMGLASARAGNVIGGGDWAQDRLVPDLLAAFVRGDSALVRNPHAVRPWQHVLEPLRGYLALAERLYSGDAAFAEAWNFGPEQQDAVSVEVLAMRLAKLWGMGARYTVQQPASGGHEAAYLTIDAGKARERLGWRPRLALVDALRLTADWTRQWAGGADARALCLAQIANYEDIASH